MKYYNRIKSNKKYIQDFHEELQDEVYQKRAT